MGIRIDAFKIEYQKMIRSNMKKFDRNHNGLIDSNEIVRVISSAKSIDPKIKDIHDLMKKVSLEDIKKEQEKIHSQKEALDKVLGIKNKHKLYIYDTGKPAKKIS